MAKSILRKIGSVGVSGAKRFVASEKFTKANPTVKFAKIGDNFSRLLGDKVENNIIPTTLNVHSLTESSDGKKIIIDLDNKAEIYLAYVYELLTRQPNCESGVLGINHGFITGIGNIFHILGNDGKLYPVGIEDNLMGWIIEALPSTNLEEYTWHSGCKVFCL